MKTIGRLLVRSKKIAGIFLPMGEGGLEPGLYDVQEVLGEIQLKYLGKAALKQDTLDGVDTTGVMNNRPYSVMTEDELKSIGG